jgi:HPt (histidine-containing phosphotransfer) domain-containing protein
MTAHAMGGDRERCLAAGMDDYIAKPVRMQDLLAALARWTPGADAPPRASSPSPTAMELDRAEILDYLDGSETLLASLVATFQANSGTRLEELRAGIAAADAMAVQLAAHSLRGSMAIFGAKRGVDAAFLRREDRSERRLEQCGGCRARPRRCGRCPEHCLG